MITKGILKTIDYNNNSCTVRLPLFEGVGNTTEVVLSAVFLNQPGSYNGYNEGDIVFVDFENDKLNNPIILGKLYLGAEKENSAVKKGGLTVANLNVTTGATLPLDTKLVFEDPTSTVPVSNGLTTYKSLIDIIKGLYKNETSITDVAKQNADAVASIKVEYLSCKIDDPAPTADAAWGVTIPAYKDGYNIWQKTTCLNHRGQILSTEIICISTLNYVASYWLRCSTRVHAGNQQKDIIEIVAMTKLGADVETEDTEVTLEYRWSNGATKAPEGGTGKYKLIFKYTEEAPFPNENLLITAKRNGVVYESETIVFSPLNTPTLVLSNDSDKLEYDSYGIEKINATDSVTSTAKLLLNNEEVAGVTYKWTLSNCSENSTKPALTDNTGWNPIVEGNSITIYHIADSADIATATCEAKYTDNVGSIKTLTKVFSVTKSRQGKSLYKIDIDNDFVTLPANENGEIADSIDLATLSTHTLSCYYGDRQLAIDFRGSAEPTTDNVQFWIKYTPTTNVTIEEDFSNILEFQVKELTGTTGSILYELYRDTSKVAVAKFEISKLIQGVAATSYWVDYSARVHKGTNQQDPITATAWTKYGSNVSTQNDNLKIRYGWRQADGTFGEYSDPNAGQITIPVANFKNADLIFELGTIKTGEDGESYFDIEDSEIITYSPIETPVLDLSNDSATLAYKPNGDKIGEATVSSTATVYLDGQKLIEGVTYAWSTGETTPELEISTLTNETEEFTCTATITNPAIFKNPVILTKVFTVSKQIQGEYSISYWLKLSSGVHLGANQQAAITATAMQKVGTNATEDVDESATLKYSFDGTTWNTVPGRVVGEGEAAKTYYDTFDSSKIENFQFEAKDFLIRAYHGEVIYETETITYSPLNTPVLDLDNDTDTILYPAKPEDDSKGPLGTPVTSTATLYLNGDELEEAAYSWKLEGCSTSTTAPIDEEVINNKTVTVAALNTDTARAICTATVTAEGPFQNKTYTKAFTVSKTRKGDNAIVYSLVMNQKGIVLDPNTETSKTVPLSGTCYMHDGNQIQPYSGGEVQYRIDAQSDNDQDSDDDFIEISPITDGKFEFNAKEVTTQVEIQLIIDGQVVDKEIIKVVKDGINAVSPYAIDIYNDTVTVLTETAELSDDYNWKTNTTHEIKIFQGSTPIETSKITVKPTNDEGTYTPADDDKDLVLTYKLTNILETDDDTDQFKEDEDSSTTTKKVYYITGLTSAETLTGQIEYSLYHNGDLVATDSFRFSKILTGVSIVSVTNMYYATANADADQANPQNSGEKLPAFDEKDNEGNLKWKASISETGYGETKPYLWNYEIIKYSSGAPTTTPIALLGSRGKGIKALSEYYLLTSTSTTPTKPTTENLNGWEEGESAPTQPTSTEPYLWNVEKVEYTDGDVEFTNPILVGTYTRSIKEVKNYYYATTSDTASLPDKDNAAWKTTITETGFNATNKYLWNYEEVIYDRAITDGSTDTSKTTDIELISIWSKEIREIKEFYLISKSMNSTDFDTTGNRESDWVETLKTPTEVYPYLWNKETTYYTDGTEESTNPIILSTFARSIIGVTNYYLATTTEALPVDPVWQTSIGATGFSAINKYLWNYEEITYDLPLTNGKTTSETEPEIISTWSKSIDKIEEYYLISKSNDKDDFNSETNREADWSLTAIAPNSSYPYLWNKEATYYTDAPTTAVYTDPVIIGTYGETFGVNIIPNVSSIVLQQDDTYNPTSLTIKFNEVSGTTVIECGNVTTRKYKYKLYKIEGSTTTQIGTDVELTPENKTCVLKINNDNKTTGQYQIELLLKNNDEWVVVDTENIPVVKDGINGNDATSYWLKCSTPIHVGKNQTEDLVIIPYKKTGLSKEDTDTDAYIRYKWINETDFTAWQKVTTANGITIKSEAVKANDLLIQATHDAEGTERTVYEEETITYSPLNTPALDLSNDSASIVYKDNIKLGDSSVSCTAALYLNGETIDAEVLWFLMNCTATQNATSKWSEISNPHTKTAVNSPIITISDLSANTATATCWAFEKLYEPKLIIYRATCTEAEWATYGTLGHLEHWTNAAPVPDGNYFVVIGKSTDKNKTHVLWYQSQEQEPASTTAYGECVAHKIFYEKDFTITKQLKGADSIVSVIESSMGTSFKKPLGNRTTTLTAYLYEGTELLDNDREWYYEWYWFDTREAAPKKVVISRTKENSVTYDEEKGDSTDSHLIVLSLKDLINKSVYFIAYPEGQVSLEGPVLGVARLGIIPLGKN